MALVDQIIGVESGGNADVESSSNVAKKLLTNSLVLKLLFPASPSAILWRVVSIYVDAINRMSLGWFLAHVCKEIFETVSPSLANFNTPRSVPLVGNMPIVLTSSDHAAPRVIFCRRTPPTRHRNRFPVCGIRFFSSFDFPAAATVSVAGSKVWNGNRNNSPAVALAKIATNTRSSILSDLRLGFAYCNKTTKPQSGAIDGGCH